MDPANEEGVAPASDEPAGPAKDESPPPREEGASPPGGPAAPPSRPGAVHPVVPFLLAGWLIGAGEGALSGTTESPLQIMVLAGVLTSVLAAPLGLLAWIGARSAALLRRTRPGKRLFGLPRTAGDPAPILSEESRVAALRTLAFALSALVFAALAVGGAQLFVLGLFDLQEQELARQLALVNVTGIVGAALAGAGVTARGVHALLVAIDRRRRLPLPAPRWGLWLLFVTAPLFLAFYPFLREYGTMLGVLRDAWMVLLLAALGVQIWLLMQLLPGRAQRASSIVVAALAVIGVGLVGLNGGKWSGSLTDAERSPAALLGGRLARLATDVDRDGASSLFGGQDCAPLDASRSPSRTEKPGNGIDEDCNGSDALPPVEARRGKLFSDALRQDQIRDYNVVWIILETVRADHVSAISYAKPTTPYLEHLAEESLVFTHAYSQSSATVLSVPSMLSGVDPGMARWKREKGHPQLGESVPLLAERLKKKGYRTGFVLDTYLQSNFLSIQRGYSEMLLAEPDDKKENNRPRRNLLSTAKAAEILARSGPGDWLFMTVYYPDQHSPYTRHPDVDSSAFEANELGDYDTELAFGDQQIRALVEMLKARPAIWDRTILIINADHGEEFGEHGGARHAQTCHDEVVHVPLIVRIPGIPAQRIDARVGLVDVVPTVLEMLGERNGTERLTGQSLLVPALQPEKVDPSRPLFCDIASITSKYGTFFRRAVRDGQNALLLDVREGRSSLFDSRTDPSEQQDISGRAENLAKMSALRALLDAGLTGNLTEHTRMGKTEDAAPR